MSSGGAWRRRAVTALWLVAVLSVFLLPYAQLPGWSFPASTAVLLGLFVLRWRRRAFARAGIPIGLRSIALTMGAAVVLWAVIRFAVAPAVVEAHDLTVDPWPAWIRVGFLFQALNEEIVLGYLLLTILVRWTHRPVAVALGVAVVFALLHVALYRYGTLGMELLPLTFLTLAAVGMVRNAAILTAGHVGFAWALHASWNFVMFTGRWSVKSDGRVLQEPEVLDAFLGTPWMALPSLLLGLLLLGVLYRLTRERTRAAAAGPGAASRRSP